MRKIFYLLMINLALVFFPIISYTNAEDSYSINSTESDVRNFKIIDVYFNVNNKNIDTDGDGYKDKEEIDNGYNPVGEGGLRGGDGDRSRAMRYCVDKYKNKVKCSRIVTKITFRQKADGRTINQSTSNSFASRLKELLLYIFTLLFGFSLILIPYITRQYYAEKSGFDNYIKFVSVPLILRFVIGAILCIFFISWLSSIG